MPSRGRTLTFLGTLGFEAKFIGKPYSCIRIESKFYFVGAMYVADSWSKALPTQYLVGFARLSPKLGQEIWPQPLKRLE